MPSTLRRSTLQVFSVQNTRDFSMASAHASQIKAGTSFCPGSSRRNRAMERFVASFVRKDRSHEFFSCEFFSCQTLVLTLLNTKLASPRSTTLRDFANSIGTLTRGLNVDILYVRASCVNCDAGACVPC